MAINRNSLWNSINKIKSPNTSWNINNGPNDRARIHRNVKEPIRRPKKKRSHKKPIQYKTFTNQRQQTRHTETSGLKKDTQPTVLNVINPYEKNTTDDWERTDGRLGKQKSNNKHEVNTGVCKTIWLYVQHSVMVWGERVEIFILSKNIMQWCSPW